MPSTLGSCHFRAVHEADCSAHERLAAQDPEYRKVIVGV